MEKCYPKWIYHKSEQPKVVNSEEEHNEAGEGWEETPAAFDKKSDEAPKKQTPDKDEAGKDQEPDIKKIDLLAMTVAELKEALHKKGAKDADLKGLKKDELIVMLGAS